MREVKAVVTISGTYATSAFSSHSANMGEKNPTPGTHFSQPAAISPSGCFSHVDLLVFLLHERIAAALSWMGLERPVFLLVLVSAWMDGHWFLKLFRCVEFGSDIVCVGC